MTRNRFFLCFLMILALFAFSACGSDDRDTTGDTGAGGDTASSGGSDTTSSGGTDTTGGGGDGQTACFTAPQPELYCSAGQYCADSDFRDCRSGCLSNDNCTSEQTCDKSAGGNVGSCQNNMVTPTGPTLAEFTAKCKACEPAATDAQCEMFYNAVNEECRTCVVGANCSDDTACEAACSF